MCWRADVQGYEWDAATCRACDLHLGWYFHSIDPAPGDAPTEFFGLRLSSLCFESLKGSAKDILIVFILIIIIIFSPSLSACCRQGRHRHGQAAHRNRTM